MARFVSHTSASENVDGAGTSGGNNKMERGSSVVATLYGNQVVLRISLNVSRILNMLT